MTAAHSGLHGCTIISENYLPYARVLAKSFLALHPESQFYVLLVGRSQPHIRRSEEPFEIIEVEELPNLPEPRSFLFKYTVLECNTAVKPYFLEHLFKTHGLEKLAYFDPDIQIFTALDPLCQCLDDESIVLTPHLTAPLSDGMFPDELAILRAGAYNLGFIGLRWSSSTQDFLRWWQGHVFDRCVVRPEQGLFVDQKWIDLVPGLFAGVALLTEPGYNVAYWNLAHRGVSLEPRPTANGKPLYFFHFSGIQPDSIAMVSSHQDRLRPQDLGEARALYETYRDLLFEAGYKTSIGWSSAFADFDDGTAIPDLARSLYLSMGPAVRRFGDPFRTNEGSFFRSLNEPASGAPRHRPCLSRLMQHLYSRSPELHRRFPDPSGNDLTAFLRWLAITGQDRHGLADLFLTPNGAKPRGSTSVRRRLRSAASDAWTSQTSRRIKQWAKRRLGPERTGRLRESVRPAPPTVPLVAPRPDLPTIRRPGINLIGYFEAESGMGQGARALSHAIEKAEIPLSLHSLDLNVLARQQDRSIGTARSYFPWDINLVFVNADQVEPVREHLGSSVFFRRYNIGFWLWELEQFPAALQGAFSRFHEIWTPSRFCLEALSSVAPIPVRRVPLPVEPPRGGERTRSHFGLPDEPFLFLFVFDFLSHVERKNPDAVVAAFREAFGDSEDVLLVLKASHTEFDEVARRRLEQAGEASNVRWIAEEIDRCEVDDLIRLCDCYVSLHRCEGFGLTLAEALSLDRPVIATDYSGSTDLLGAGTGLPVRYDLVELEHDVGPYEAGAQWAKPDIQQAVERMRWVYEHPEEAAALGRRAGEETRARFATEPVSRVLRQRFEHILAATPSPTVGGPALHRTM